MTEAELLFTQILSCDRVSLYLNKKNLLNKRNSSMVSSVLKRRISGEPIQYVLGKTEFMGFEFKVNKDVFIPRPETEILVETARKQLSAFSSQLSAKDILDLGTGSGCIAISLAKLLPEAKIDAIDISEKALNIARDNTRIHEVLDRLTFIQSDLFDSLAATRKQYSICVSNPPYIANGDLDKLDPAIAYEPRIALEAGEDGLYFYKIIINNVTDYLIPGGLLILELGFNQLNAVRNIFLNSKNFQILEVVKDYNNIDRIIVAKRLS